MTTAARAIGHITKATGDVTIETEAGEHSRATAGMAVALHDRLVTGPDSHVEIAFADGGVFAMAANSAMALDKFAYDPQSTHNSLLIAFARGAFEFVAGKIAHLLGDGMQVTTPAGTLGVRGTAGAAAENPETHDWTFMLLRDPGGHLGRILLFNAAGQVMLDEWMEASILRSGEAPAIPRILSAMDAHAIFGASTGMIRELDDQVPLHTPEDGLHHDRHASHHDAPHSGGRFDPTVIVGEAFGSPHDPSFQPINLAMRAILNFLPNGPALIGDGNHRSILGVYDDLFHHPLIPPPLHKPGDFHHPPGFNLVDGTAGNDNLAGTPGPDRLSGLAGQDVLAGSPGDDVFDGGSGTDSVVYNLSTPPHGIHIDLGAAKALNDGYGDVDRFISIENIVGSNQSDSIDARGAGPNDIDGDAGNDTIQGDAGDTLRGGAGDDHIFAAAPGSGRIEGGADDDHWHLVDSAGQTIDLSTVDVSGIENIHLDASANSSVTLQLTDVLDISDATHALAIFGDADNSVTSTGQGWASGGTTMLDGHSMDIYMNGGVTLLVEHDIQATVS
jgi:hypothetical protein